MSENIEYIETPPVTETVPEIKMVTATELTASIVPEMPVVTQSVSSAEPQTDLFPETKPVENLDNSGAKFCPQYHKTDENGKPFKNRDGNFVRQKNGRMSKEEKEAIYGNRPSPSSDSSPKSKVSGVNNPPKPASEPEQKQTSAPSRIHNEPEAVNYETSAEMYLQTGYALLTPFFGDEIRPESDAEHNSLKVPLVALLKEKGEIPFTPTQMFCLALISYAGRKYTKPTVKEKVIALYLRIKNMFSKK